MGKVKWKKNKSCVIEAIIIKKCLQQKKTIFGIKFYVRIRRRKNFKILRKAIRWFTDFRKILKMLD